MGSNNGNDLAPSPIGAPDSNGNLIGTAATPIDPRLGPLANNGGPTLTHALMPGSPALDAGDPAAIAGIGEVPLYDQRAGPFSRVVDGDGDATARIDMGAFESQSPLPAISGDYNKDEVVDAADYVVWRKMFGATGLSVYSGADGSGNGAIDEDDYNIWQANFGRNAPPEVSASVATVTAAEGSTPYPTSFDNQLHLAATDSISVAPLASNPRSFAPRLPAQVAIAMTPHEAIVAWRDARRAHQNASPELAFNGSHEKIDSWRCYSLDAIDECFSALEFAADPSR